MPYQEPAAKGDAADFSSTLSSTLPMAAIFTRNRYIGWASIVFSVQSWLGESEEATKTSTTPGYFTIGMSCEFYLLLSISRFSSSQLLHMSLIHISASTTLSCALKNGDKR